MKHDDERRGCTLPALAGQGTTRFWSLAFESTSEAAESLSCVLAELQEVTLGGDGDLLKLGGELGEVARRKILRLGDQASDKGPDPGGDCSELAAEFSPCSPAGVPAASIFLSILSVSSRSSISDVTNSLGLDATRFFRASTAGGEHKHGCRGQEHGDQETSDEQLAHGLLPRRASRAAIAATKVARTWRLA